MAAATTTDVVVVTPTWTSPPLATFEGMAATIESRFGPPTERDLDSNGVGLFDWLCIRFHCGLELGLSRFHLGAQLRSIDPLSEPSIYEIAANDRDLAHVAFHLEVPLESMHLWTNRDGVPLAGPPPPPCFTVMRTDDNGNDFEVKRVTNRCEADALVRAYQARGHKQTYWFADVVASTDL